MGFGDSSKTRSLMSEINVTPFVDVMLVLLVIFMVTAPILYHGVNVDLPKTESRPIPAMEREKKLVITVDGSGDIFIEKEKLSLKDLRLRIRSEISIRGKSLKDNYVYIRADSGVPYGRVIEVMAVAQKAGANRLGLVTEPARTTAGKKSGARK